MNRQRNEDDPRSAAADAPVSDGEVIARVLAGDREQFAVLAERYWEPLMRVALGRMPDREAAEDAVQETFLNALKSLHSYNSLYSFRTWLWTILLNQCRRQLKRQARGQWLRGDAAEGGEQAGGERAPSTARELAEGLLGRELEPAEHVVVRERAERLKRLLDRLPAAQADAIRLRFYGGLKFQEIATAMGCSLSTAKNRVRWGLEKLSTSLQTSDRGAGPESGTRR